MLLDIGIGILLSLYLGPLLGVPMNGMWIVAGILFALSPDADYLVHLLLGGSSRNAHKHRDIFHYPLLFIPAGMLVLLPFGFAWSMLFGLAALAHLIHDSIGIGWGVQWLWPFGSRHYSFLYLYKPKHRPEKLPRKLVYAWEHHEISDLAARFGDEDWIRNIYLRWHPYAIAEFIVFLIAIIVLFSYLSP